MNLIQQEINGLTEAGFLTGTFPPNIHDLNPINLFKAISNDAWAINLLQNGVFEFEKEPDRYH